MHMKQRGHSEAATVVCGEMNKHTYFLSRWKRYSVVNCPYLALPPVTPPEADSPSLPPAPARR